MMNVAMEGTQLVIDGKPRFIYAGDFSYGRAPRRVWKERLQLMKQAGLNCISFYCVWRFHEPQKGEWDFAGNHDLAALLDLIAELKMFAIFRMGPFVHGEYRNGGFPDWLVAELGAELRTNSRRYLELSARWYERLLEIAVPRLYSSGGPIILLQLENELGSAGCKGDDIPRGNTDPEENRRHLEFYCDLIRNAGVDLPLIDINKVPGKEELLGAFADSGGFYPANCFGTDGELAQFTPRENAIRPMVSIETGCGMFVRFFDYPPYRHTNGFQGPLIQCAQVEALAQQTVAEGANGIGFFVFNDGQHLGEDNEAMIPRRNMNFQAPITCVGQLRDSYRALKRLGWFIRACETELVRTQPNRGWALVRSCGVAHPGEVPEAGDLFAGYGHGEHGGAAMATRPVETLSRITPGLNMSESNFLFMRNVRNGGSQWQRDIRVQTCPDQLACEVNQEYPKLVQMELPPGSCKIMPFFVRMQPGYFLTHSTGTLLERRPFGDGALAIVYAKRDEFIESVLVTPKSQWRTMNGLLAVPQSPNQCAIVGKPDCMPQVARCGTMRYVVVNEAMAGDIWEVDGSLVAFSDMQLLASTDGVLTLRTCGSDFYFALLSPEKMGLVGDFDLIERRELEEFDLYCWRGVFRDPQRPSPCFRRSVEGNDLILELEVAPEMLDGLDELVLRLEFDGQFGQAWLDDELISDHYYGKFLFWEIGLRDWLRRKSVLRLRLSECCHFHAAWQEWRIRELKLNADEQKKEKTI